MVVELGKRLPPGGILLKVAIRDLVPEELRAALEAAEQAWIAAGRRGQVRQNRPVWNEWLRRETIYSDLVWHPTYLTVNGAHNACRQTLRELLSSGGAIAAGCLGGLTGDCWAVEPSDWGDPGFWIMPVNYREKARNRIHLADKQELWQVRIYENASIQELARSLAKLEPKTGSDSLTDRVMGVLTEMIARGELDGTRGGQARAIWSTLERLKEPSTSYSVVRSYISPIWKSSLAKSEANRKKPNR